MKKILLMMFMLFMFVGCGQDAQTNMENDSLPSYEFLQERINILAREYGYMTQYIDEKTQEEYGEIQQFMQDAVMAIKDKGDRREIVKNLDEMESRLRKLAPKINYQIAIEEITTE